MDARFALLLGCFVLSGFAALLYQTVWSRELSFVFGTSELAISAVLAAYMGGLALGSAAAARWAPRLRRPIRAYGLLELGIGVSALLVPSAIELVDRGYIALRGNSPELPASDAATTAFQLAGAFAVLLIPTALMGATLGLIVGVFLAALVAQALSGEGIVFTIPWLQLVYFIIAAIIVGVLAAVIPARRASRLNVLEALQYE